MKTILKNAHLLPEYGFGDTPVFVTVEGRKIQAIETLAPDEKGCETVDCGGNLLIPAFYNTHCHAAMTLFRGFGEDLPLQKWLEEKIFPAEDRLTAHSVYVASLLAIAEMLKGGIASFSDMYMFEEQVALAVLESGIKGNLSRDLVSFEPNINLKENRRFTEAVALAEQFHRAGDGRVLVDFSVHAEYTNQEDYVRKVADYVRGTDYRLKCHLSETEKEVAECVARRGKTPPEFFRDAGFFDVPTTAAHCVYLSDSDIQILKEKNVTVSHNPVSNQKLGSGVMPLRKLLDAGVNVTLGTDGVASNNRLDLLREMQTAAILHKGANRDASITTAREMFPLLTRNGALAQGREDCGEIRVGFCADLVLLDRNALHNQPIYDDYAMLAYSAERADVLMTMVDGRILYRNGEYTSIDEERLKYDFHEVVAHYFD